MRDSRREEILSAAARLFATRGLAATKVKHIAAAVGMSQGLLYHYFPAKEDIYIEIVRIAFDKLNAAVLALEADPRSPKQKLEAAATQLLRTIAESDDFAWYSTLISQASVTDALPPEVTDLIRRQRDVPYKAFARIIRCGQKDGTLRPHDATELALVFWTTIKGLALHKAALGSAYRSPQPTVLMSLFLDEE